MRLSIPVLPSSGISLLNVFGGQPLSSDYNLDEIVRGEQLTDSQLLTQVQTDSLVKENIIEKEVTLNLEQAFRITGIQLAYLIWLTGGISVAIYFIYGYFKVKTELNKLEQVNQIDINQLLDSIKNKLKIRGKIRVVRGNQALIFGVVTPTIVLPKSEDIRDIEAMLTHELMHYKYKDNVITYIQLLILVIHWFNPLVWIGMYLMKQDMEFACDERVLESGVNRKHYAVTLLNNTQIAYTKLYLVHSLGENKNQTKKRILHMASFKKPKTWMSGIACIIIIIMAVLCLTNPHNKKIKVNGTTNIAVFGVDQSSSRTDTIMVVNLNNDTKRIKIVSVPRDTKVTWDDAQKEIIKKESGINETQSKINEMTVLGGIKNIRELSISAVEDLIGQRIDNYIVLDLDSVNKIIDTVGGLEIEVPMDMYYEDPYQDLLINLKKGKQILSGEQVEELVRFRKGYPDGDLGRINSQALVVDKFAEELLKSTNSKKIGKLASKLYKDTYTDISLNEVKQYCKILKSIDLKGLEFYIIPGEGEYENNRVYYIVDVEASQKILKN